MTQDTIDDLKQFIAATVMQSTQELRGQMQGLEGRVDGLESRMGNLETGVSEVRLVLETALDAHAVWLENHEQRLIVLEGGAA